MSKLDGRHLSVRSIMPFFDYQHLPAPLQVVSAEVYSVAHGMVAFLPDGPELTAGLRKLLEAKDCFVRAAVEAKKEK